MTISALYNPREDGEYITGLARGLSVLRAFSVNRIWQRAFLFKQ